MINYCDTTRTYHFSRFNNFAHYWTQTSILIILVLLMCQGCFPRYFRVPKGETVMSRAQVHYSGGAAMVDITPHPGTSMAGYGSDIGKVSRGHLNRLYSSATYLEDKKGNYLFIVANDIWGFPQGLGDKVMALLKDPSNNFPIKIARENVIFAATHTHNSQGNYATSYGYNLGSSTFAGFDQDQFDFLAKSLSTAIVAAYQAREPVSLRYATKKIIGLTRNRSIDAWHNNRWDDKQIFHTRITDGTPYVSDMPKCLADRAEQFIAIDPTITSIILTSIKDKKPISVINNFAVHPTVMGAANVLASADIYGVANSVIKNYLTTKYNYAKTPVVAFLNGAEGDISANWRDHGLLETVRIGNDLSKAVIEMLESGNDIPITRDIQVRLEFKPIKNQPVSDPDLRAKCKTCKIEKTAKTPMIGKAALAGAEDARVNKETVINECGFDESLTNYKCNGPHGSKDKYGVSVLAKWSAPKSVPVGVYDIGTLRMVTMPGETTVTLGERLKAIARDKTTSHIFLIGLANEYLSYFATPAEYEMQHYEGASTVYGMASALFFEEEVERVSLYGASVPKYYGIKSYRPSSIFLPFKKRKIQRNFRQEPFNSYHILSSLGLNRYQPNKIKTLEVGWAVPVALTYDDIPEVHIEYETGNKWQPLFHNYNLDKKGLYKIRELQSDQTSYSLINYVSGNGDGHNQWQSLWIIPPSLKNLKIKMVMKIGNQTFRSVEYKI